MVSKRIHVELENLNKNPIEGVTIEVDQSNTNKLTVYMAGPQGSIYAGGTFKILCLLPEKYPFKPPEIKFDTKIYHPGVSQKDGKICMEVYEAKWAPTQTLSNVFQLVRGMLISPTIENMVDEEIGGVFKSNQGQFEKTAKEWVSKFAK